MHLQSNSPASMLAVPEARVPPTADRPDLERPTLNACILEIADRLVRRCFVSELNVSVTEGYALIIRGDPARDYLAEGRKGFVELGIFNRQIEIADIDAAVARPENAAGFGIRADDPDGNAIEFCVVQLLDNRIGVFRRVESHEGACGSLVEVIDHSEDDNAPGTMHGADFVEKSLEKGVVDRVREPVDQNLGKDFDGHSR
jgi:hypothetical protein